MLVALLALFVALGGSSYAAVTLSNNSVKSKHIKNGQVKRADIRASAVNSGKVADGSLQAGDFAAGQIPPGPAGPAGPAGSAGAKGDKGDPGQPGAPGTARAYAVGGNICEPFCVLTGRSKGVSYIVRVGTGIYCVGATGINAAAPGSVAIVSAARAGFAGVVIASWRSNNSACASNEFEVETRYLQSSLPPVHINEHFSIAIL